MPWGDDLGVFVDQDGHSLTPYLTASTIFWAASAMVSARDDREARIAQDLLADLFVGALHGGRPAGRTGALPWPR